MTSDIYIYSVFSKALAFLLVVHAANEELTISLFRVFNDGALIDWHFNSEHKLLKRCEVVYRLISDKEQQRLSRLNISEKNLNVSEKRTVDLPKLQYNVTYSCHMVCYDKKDINFTSNIINFTTGIEQDDFLHDGISSNIHKISSGYSDNPIPVSSDVEHTRSSKIILGAICGIICFLIINVTVVLAVRKYSYWHIRRRRILETEDHEYDGLDYLRDEE